MEENNKNNESLQNENNKDDELVVGGFLFSSKKEADKGKIDIKKIDYLESHIKMNSIVNMQTVYAKSIQNKIFGTPIGFGYLLYIRRQIEKEGGEVNSLPLLELPPEYSTGDADDVSKAMDKAIAQGFDDGSLSENNAMNKTAGASKNKKTNSKSDKFKKNLLFYSVAFNIILLIAIIGMFVIASTNDSTTILNYEENILNEYSIWEKELEEREATVKEKERELGITNTEKDLNNESSIESSN